MSNTIKSKNKYMKHLIKDERTKLLIENIKKLEILIKDNKH